MSGNSLTGPIPSTIGNLQKLIVLFATLLITQERVFVKVPFLEIGDLILSVDRFLQKLAI